MSDYEKNVLFRSPLTGEFFFAPRDEPRPDLVTAAIGAAGKPRVVVTERIMGIYHMQVCCVPDASDEEILAVCNQENPSGTAGGWTRVYRMGINQPTPCADDPARVHVLVAC
jgi:hypothetical protein